MSRDRGLRIAAAPRYAPGEVGVRVDENAIRRRAHRLGAAAERWRDL